MKKKIALFMALVLLISIFAGCNSEDTDSDRRARRKEDKGYEECVENIVDVLAGEEISQARARKTQPEAYFEYMEEQGNSFSEYYEQVQDQCKTNANSMITAFGKDFEVSYEIIEDNQLSNEERYEATKHLNSDPWYNAENLKEVRDLTIEIYVTGERGSRTFTMTMQVMQQGESWYVLSLNSSEIEEFLN